MNLTALILLSIPLFCVPFRNIVTLELWSAITGIDPIEAYAITLLVAPPALPVAPTQQSQLGQIPTAVRERLSGLVPNPPPAQATAQERPVFYGSSNLYQYMDGAADIFQIYDVQALFHQDFKAGPAELTVDIFDMGTLENAFGIYAAERSPKYDFMTIGGEGYRNEGILNFFQDRYYVKLAGFGEGADAVLEAFAQALSTRIVANPGFPAFLARLPVENRQPHSAQYMPNSPLGHPFLGPAYTVAYKSGDQESRLFVTLARDEADAQDRLRLLKLHFAKTGQGNPVPELGEGAIRASNSFEGSIMAQTMGRYLLLLVNPGIGAEQLLRKTAISLK